MSGGLFGGRSSRERLNVSGLPRVRWMARTWVIRVDALSVPVELRRKCQRGVRRRHEHERMKGSRRNSNRKSNQKQRTKGRLGPFPLFLLLLLITMSPRARLTFHHPVVYPKLNGIAIPPFPPPLNLHTAFLNSNSNDLAINWKLFPAHPSQKQLWDDYLADGGLAQRAEVDIVGLFSLEPLVQEGDADGVGIRVDGHVVVVSTGTKVFRGLGMGAGGKEGRSLWWRGTMMNGGRAGIWTLGLIGWVDVPSPERRRC